MRANKLERGLRRNGRALALIKIADEPIGAQAPPTAAGRGARRSFKLTLTRSTSALDLARRAGFLAAGVRRARGGSHD
jgi:hypothetical protein